MRTQGKSNQPLSARVAMELCGSRVSGLVELHPEMFKELDVVGLSWVTDALLHCCMEDQDNSCRVSNLLIVPVFKMGPRECFPLMLHRDHTAEPLWKSFL